MEIQQLRHFVAAAQTKSYVRAARLCSTSRQNIAHSIKVLESECKSTFFKRGASGMELTPQGVQAAKKAETVVGKVDALNLMFSQVEEDDSGLNIAVSTNLFDGMPPCTEEFFMTLPDTMRFTELDCERCYNAVRQGEADVAIVMCMQREFDGCDVFEVAGSASYALVGSDSPLAKKRCVAAGDLAGCELAVMSDPDFQYAPLVAQLAEAGYRHDGYSVVSGTNAVVHMVKRGSVAFVSGVFASDPPSGTVAVPLSDPRLSWHFYMLFRPYAHNFRTVMDLCENVHHAFECDERSYGSVVCPSLVSRFGVSPA